MTLRLRSGDGPYLRVGHQGAAALAPANTIASFEAALAEGVDLVEFDVLRDGDRLVLAHAPEDVTPDCLLLDDALSFLAASAPPEVGMDLDLKWHGYEEPVVGAIARHGLLGRTVVSSLFAESLRLVKQLEPALATGISYPWDRHGMADRPLLSPVVRTGVLVLRGLLPYRIGRMLAEAGADAAMINHLLVSRALVARCHALGAGIFAWTVDDRAVLERMLAAGADGIISNNPHLLSS